MKQIFSSLIIFYILNFNLIYSQPLHKLASGFLGILDDSLKEKTLFNFDSSEKTNMQFVPYKRKGSSFNDFNEVQKRSALKLLRASLSKEGFKKVEEIILLENVLLKIEQPPIVFRGEIVIRDPLDYHFWIFGDPESNDTWGWKFEGHHISLNFTSNNNKIVSSTPSFMGSNPAIVNIKGFKKKQVLKKEMLYGMEFAKSLDENQKKIAQFSKKAPKDIFTNNSLKISKLDPLGLSFNDLNVMQKKIFLKLLNVYIDNYQFGFAKDFRKKIQKAGIENLHFAYAGNFNNSEGYYYRIQGPMLIIEYDNIQNNANHVHSVVRDLTNDWGEEILKNHYLKDHTK